MSLKNYNNHIHLQYLLYHVHNKTFLRFLQFYYNLNTFEVWYDEENEKILKSFAQKMNDQVSGVPYTIIGNQSYIGFGEEEKEEMIDAIISQHKNSYDVYFDLLEAK